jgi:hypothetical protein
MINNRDINIRLIIHVAKCLGDPRKSEDEFKQHLTSWNKSND